uniref:Uncharacterized protein n=1 Tax=Knipowitschia caucasica TaxID=637954 RepID=A0AAV2M5P7_KNICA
MDIRTWLKKPNTTPAVSPQPGSSYRRTGEAEEHLPRPWQQVPRQMEESDSPAGPPVPIASDPGSAVFGAARPPSHSQQQLCLPEDLGVEKPVQGTPVPPKRLRQTTGALQDYVVSEGLGQREADIQQECKRLFFAIIDSILCEMAARFSERNGTYLYMTALNALDPVEKEERPPNLATLTAPL